MLSILVKKLCSSSVKEELISIEFSEELYMLVGDWVFTDSSEPIRFSNNLMLVFVPNYQHKCACANNLDKTFIAEGLQVPVMPLVVNENVQNAMDLATTKPPLPSNLVRKSSLEVITATLHGTQRI